MSENEMVVLTKIRLINGQNIVSIVFLRSKKKLDSQKVFTIQRRHFDYIYSDLLGPSKTPSNRGVYYMLTVLNDFSRKFRVLFLKQKNDMVTTFKQWKTIIESKLGSKLNVFTLIMV